MKRSRRLVFPNVVRALIEIDAANDFGSDKRSAIPVPNGNSIGPIIGNLQVRGKSTNFFRYQIDIRDAHPVNMFNFLENNRADVARGITRVPDASGSLQSLLPMHMIPNTWGWQLLPGIHQELFDMLFRKGERQNQDQFSAATPEVVQWLQQRGVSDVYLVGHVLRICVGTSAINFARAGFRVHVVKDATGDIELAQWADVLDLMGKTDNIDYVTSEELLRQMVSL